MKSKYQLFERLRDEDYAALKADIENRGVQVAVEFDEDGNILDGHHRKEIADSLGISYPKKVRKFKTEADKRNHVIKMNMARRHLDPIEWGQAFKRLLEERGVQRGKGKVNQHTVASATVAEAAAELGVPERTARHRLAQADKMEELPVEAQEAIRNRKTSITKVKRAEKAESIAKKLDWPTDKFRVIYADPPWSYGNTQPDYQTEQRDHYPVMTLKDICDMPVKSIAMDDAVLFMWVTSPILEESFDVINAWGFKYKSSFVWDKIDHNMGHYNSVRHELLLIGVRGSCQPDVPKLFDSVVSEKRLEHSAKPDSFRNIIDTIYPHGPRIELFSRKKLKGWKTYGHQS